MGGSRKNRQPDANMQEASGNSSESGDKTNSDDGCPHVGKEFVRSKVTNCLKKGPLNTECNACKKSKSKGNLSPTEEVASGPLWICLHCANQACGQSPKFHALEHYKSATHGLSATHCKSATHCLAADTQSWEIWCYACNKTVEGNCRRKLLNLVKLFRKISSLSSPLSIDPIPLPAGQADVGNEKAEDDKSKLSVNGLTRVVGLSNLGNTCFFNAVLQCLSQTPFLLKILEDMEAPGEHFSLAGGKLKMSEDSEEMLPPVEGTLEGWGSFTSALTKTLKAMQTTKPIQTYSPHELLAMFREKTIQCMDGGQHDSHELLRHLLEIVRSEDLRRYKAVILKHMGIGVSIKAKSANEMHKAKLKFYGKQAGARLLGAEPVFRGVLVSTLTCLECQHSFQRTEAFLDLSLPVMADKPQPPILKRKHKGLEDSTRNPRGILFFEDSFDSVDNNLSSSPPSKNQWKVDEDDAPIKRQSRLGKSIKGKAEEVHSGAPKWQSRRRDSGHHGQSSGANRICEEKQQAAPESESDADVEDNVSAVEVVESGYSSEKVSAVTSPMSPGDLITWKNSVNQDEGNGDSKLPLHQLYTDFTKSSNDDSKNKEEANGQVAASAQPMNYAPIAVETSDSNGLESPMTEAPNDNDEFAGVSPSTSLIVNSELSPEGVTISPLSSSITSKESPRSPPSSATDEKSSVIPQSSSLIFSEDRDPNWDRFHNNNHKKRPDDETMQAALRTLLMIEGPPSCAGRKLSLTDKETPEYQETENSNDRSNQEDQENLESSSPIELPDAKPEENGVADITAGLSKVSVSPSFHTNRYHTKDGDCSIQSCLNQFTARELLSGSNKVGCEACTARENKGKEGATKMVCTQSSKQYLISSVPAILILHLKRFQSQRMSFRKVPKHVSFPLLLDLMPVCKNTRKPKIYSLYGVVEHSGTLHGGHYVAYVKTRPPITPDDPRWAFLPSKDSTESAGNSGSDSEDAETKANFNVTSPPGNWYHISDSRVMQVDEATVLRSQAYILFYERIL